MKSPSLKVFLTLFLFVILSCNLYAQSHGDSGDSVKRVIVVVRPGYNDSSHSDTQKLNNSTNGSSNYTVANNQSSNSSLGAGLATPVSYSPIAPTVSERAGSPDYMKPRIIKRTPIHVNLVPQVAVNISPAMQQTAPIKHIDSVSIATNVKTKPDTVLITKTDTIYISAPKHTSNKIMFLELGGPGLAISLNYDQRFSGKKDGFGYRVGMGYFGDGGNTVFTIPLQVNYLVGSKGEYFEFGAGTTFLNTTGDNTGKTFIFDRVTGFIGTATVGVRYEPEKSLNFRLAFVPIFAGPGEEIIYAGGFSVGYTF